MPKELITSLGIDLSLVGTGLVVLENGIMSEQKLIKSKPVGERPTDELARIRFIVKQIKEMVDRYRPTIAVIENLAFMARNTTALTQLAGLNYFTRAMLVDYGIPFYLVAPTSLKKFVTGNGASKKDVMLIEVYKRWGVTILDDNICDAYGLAQIGLALMGGNSKITIERQNEVLDLLKKQL
jgi:Holliday junction resolvasome, endonuclease subunit